MSVFREALLRALQRPPGPRMSEAEYQAWLEAAKPIAFSGNVYAALGEALRRRGVSGDERALALLYTVLTSRLLTTPMTAAVKLPPDMADASPIDRLLELLPKGEVETRTGFSAKAIAFGYRSLKHKALVVRETAGLSGRDGEMLRRNLSAERGVRFEVAYRSGGSCSSDDLRREGPLALLMLTAAEDVRTRCDTTAALPVNLEETDDGGAVALEALGRAFARPPWLKRMNQRRRRQR
jgi:hypothetical protein